MAARDFLALAGRVLLAMMFLSYAFGKITNYERSVQYIAAHGIPAAGPVCLAAIALEVLGGLSLVLGFMTRWGAAALAVFIVPATLMFHLGVNERVHLLKNIAILGGLLHVLAFGPGQASLDRGP